MEILVITVWLAVVVGYSEGAFWWIKSHLFGSLIYMHPGYFWMSPVAQIALFTLPGLFLAMIAWRTKDWDVATFSVTIMSLAGWFNLFLLVPGLHNEARILAAAGLAAVTGRFFLRRQPACLRLFRRTIPWLLASIVALPFVYQLEEAERETSCMAALPASPRDGPNILFMVLDTVRADALEQYGRDASIAPNLTQLAEKGVVFEQALANAPWTLPSMASIFTGRLPHEFSADWMSPLEDEHPTIAEALSARGWLTGGFVGNTRYCSRETGLARGFAHYEGYRLTLVDFALSTGLGRMVLFGELPIRFGWLDWPGRKRAAEINGGFLQWLDRNEGRPFFAFLNYWDAHDPYIAPESFRNHWPANDLEEKMMRYWWWISKDPVTDQHLAMLKGAYEDCIRALDHEIGTLLNQLNHRGLLDNTIIIVTSDHGEHFGEHDLLLHGNSLYEPLLHVPLIVACPGKIPSGIRVREPVALNGLPNTLLEILGTDENFPGTSWVRHWSDANRPETPPEILVAELASQAGFPPCHGRSPICRHGSMRCLREGHLKYIRADDLEEELYDLAEDSSEEKNLINDPRYARDLERMRSHFRRLVVDPEPPKP